MKTVRINYTGNDSAFNKEQNLFYDILKNLGFDVQIVEDPDFLICEPLSQRMYSYCGRPQVRIMYSCENYIPDFNLIDYAISPYPIVFGDRHFQLPGCVWPGSHWHALAKKDRNYTREFLAQKEYFANFISSHESENNIRGDFFKKLSQYKRVESPGTYLNNMPQGYVVDWKTESKTDFQRKCKFTLCFESTNHYGFVTEKIMDAFYADTIPVYYGSSTAADIFNPNAFINCAEYPSFEAAIKRIKELDQDDEQYLRMLRQPVLKDPEYPDRLERELTEFVRHIFSQDPKDAYRRSRVYRPKYHDEFLARAVDEETLTMKNLLLRVGSKITGKFGRR